MGDARHLLFIPALAFLCAVAGCAGYGTSVHVHERNEGYVLHVPASKLTVTIPKGNFVKVENRIGGGTDNPTYFFFRDYTHQIILSGWFVPAEHFTGVEKFWEEQITAFEKHKMPAPSDVAFKKIGKWDATVYDMRIPDYTNSHIRAHWIQAGTWIDLHLSITTPYPSSVARTTLENTLKAVRVEEY